MTFKRIIALFLAVLLLCGCGTEPLDQPVVEPEIKPDENQVTEEEQVVLNVRISELMSSNKCTLADGYGFYDWLELYNYGSESAELGGFYLNCDGQRWALPAVSLEAGEYLLIYCSGEENKGQFHSNFKLSKDGFDIALESEEGQIIHELSAPAAESDYSIVADEKGDLSISSLPSPGFGTYEEFQASRNIGSPLIISEVAVHNEQHRNYGGYYDWIEFKNISDESIMLSDYYISDSESDFKEYQLPQKELKSGEYFVLYCDDESSDSRIAPISLNAQEDQLYLAHEDDGLVDYMLLRGIPYLGSCGRIEGENGKFLFTEISPGTANGAGVLSQAERPTLEGRDGVFNDVESVEVELSGEGKIYYSLDGSWPDENSILYEKPFTVDKTCVVRAVCIAEGKLNSQPLNLSYIINENHTLPVMSIASDPEELLGKTGLYRNINSGIESYGMATFYEEDGSFSIGCGIELHGMTSKIVSDKKSFKLRFRPRYEGRLDYDLFDNGVTEFSSVVLRAAVESTVSSLMRDNLMHQLAKENFPNLPMQDYKYCVLYVNGQYWGVYNIREAHSETHYSQHYGVDEELITHTKEKWNREDFFQHYSAAVYGDMRKDENYEAVAEHLDIDSVIGWSIIQAYSGNIDANSPNMRFYYLKDSQKLVYALVDLDLSMEAYRGFMVPLGGEYAYNYLVAALMRNDQFASKMASELSRVLNNGMSGEAVHAKLDALTAEIEPEMARDAQRWNYDLSAWENAVKRNHRYVDLNGSRAQHLARDFAGYAGLSKTEFKELFGEVK